ARRSATPTWPTIRCARPPTRSPLPSRKQGRAARSPACGTAHESRPPASAAHSGMGAGPHRSIRPGEICRRRTSGLCKSDRGIRPAKDFVLEREHDGTARQLALTISDKFRELFGKPMYGLTATITSVVLGREIESRTARQGGGNPPPYAGTRPKTVR